MKVFEQIERINKMHQLICQKRTGTPEEFAKRLNISRTCLYEYIDELRSRSAPISYSRERNTFYYKQPFEIRITLHLQAMTEDEVKNCNGGTFLFRTFFRTESRYLC